MQRLKILTLAAACSFTLAAQDPSKSERIRGCLETAEGAFTLTTDEESMNLNGSVAFEKHVGHTVEVTGLQKGSYFAVESLTHIAPSCEAAAEKRENRAEAREGESPTLTAQEQGSSPADRDLTAKIRKAIVGDDALSTYAQNVKIVTRDGRVTLLGPVRSAAEKSAVVAKVTAVAGEGVVDDQLTVEPRKKSSDPNKKEE